MTGIDAAIAEHFEVLFRDMADQAFDEIDSWNRFLDILVILVPVIVKSNRLSVIAVNPGGGDGRAAEVTADIFYNGLRITFVGFGINIKTVFVVGITGSFDFFKRGADSCFHCIKKSSAESIP